MDESTDGAKGGAQGTTRRTGWLLVWCGAAIATPVLLWLIVWLVLPRWAPASAYAIAREVPVAALPIARQLVKSGEDHLRSCIESTDPDVRNHYAGRALDRLDPAWALIEPYAESAQQGDELWVLLVEASRLRYAGRRFLTIPRP
jgi:hypothetical protein